MTRAPDACPMRDLGGASAKALALLRTHWPVIPVLLLAFWLRTRDLQPTSFYGDDAEYGIVAAYLANNPFDLTYPRIAGFFGSPFVSQPPLVLYVFALAYAIFGVDDAVGVYVSLLLGVATVGLVYALGWLMRDRATGFVAATFLAVMPFHIALSRKAMLEAGLAFFMTLAAVLALYYFRAPSQRRAIWAGVGIGLAALAKLPGFLIGVVLLLYAGVELAYLLNRRRAGEAEAGARLKALPKHLGIASAFAVGIGLLWLVLILIKGGFEDFLDKMSSQASRVAGTGENALSATSQPWTWYLGSHPFGIPSLVSETIYALAFVGVIALLVGFAARPLRNRANALPLLWLAIVFGFFGFADRKVWFYALPLTPAIAIAAAYPIAVAWRALVRLVAQAGARNDRLAKRLSSPRVRLVTQGCFAIILVVATAVPAWAAAEDAAERVASDRKFGEGVEDAARYIAAKDPGGGQVGTLLGRFTIHYYHPAPTYHYFVDNGYGQKSRWTEDAIEAGEVRWVVVDNYLDNAEEQAWLMGLVNKHGGVLEKTWGNDWGMVRLYRLNG